MPPRPSHPPIRSRKAPQLTRDQGRDYQFPRSIGWKHENIRACLNFPALLLPRQGRPPIPTQAQVEELIEFVCASAENRRMSHK